MTNETPMPFVGWMRAFQRVGANCSWRPVCSAPAVKECWEILEHFPRFGGCEWTVLRQNEDPRRVFAQTSSLNKARRHRAFIPALPRRATAGTMGAMRRFHASILPLPPPAAMHA